MAIRNRVKFTTATTGTGAVTVGAASSGFQLPATAGAFDGEQFRYTIEDGTAWETGKAVASSTATVLSRELEESSTGSLLNLSGSAIMYLTPNAAQFAQIAHRGKMLAVSIGNVSN